MTMKQQTYTVNGKEYSREQLLAFGKEHYPKLYWIPRAFGFIFCFVGLLVLALIGLVFIILDKVGAITPDFPTWIFLIPGGFFGFFFLIGLILIIVSCVGRSEQKYIDRAISYLTRYGDQDTPSSDQLKANRILDQQDLERLARYERLLKGGVISQEEYDRRRKDILK